MIRWFWLLLIPLVASADVINLQVTVDECSSALLILGPFVQQDGLTPNLPDTLTIQVNATTGPPSDRPLLEPTTVTPPTCPACTTTNGVTVTCDPGTAVCTFVLPPRANKIAKLHGPQQQVNQATIRWRWPLGEAVELAQWTVQRSNFIQPHC